MWKGRKGGRRGGCLSRLWGFCSRGWVLILTRRGMNGWMRMSRLARPFQVSPVRLDFAYLDPESTRNTELYIRQISPTQLALLYPDYGLGRPLLLARLTWASTDLHSQTNMALHCCAATRSSSRLPLNGDLSLIDPILRFPRSTSPPDWCANIPTEA